jgi:Galactose oxidase, central domain/Kelch motif
MLGRESATDAGGVLYRLATEGPLPSPRSTPAVGVVDGGIYVFGGLHDDFVTGVCTCYDDLYRLDTVGRTWERLEPEGRRPAARVFASTVADEREGRLYVFGGCRYDGFGPRAAQDDAAHDYLDGYVVYGDLWAYDVADGRWEPVFGGDGGPTARAGASMWLHDGVLLLFGGTDEQYVSHNDMWAFDLAARTWQPWTSAEPVPRPRSSAMSVGVPVRGRLIIHCGEEVGRDGRGALRFPLHHDTWAFGLRDGGWEKLSSRSPRGPIKRWSAVGAMRDHLHVYGGDAPGGSPPPGTAAPFGQIPTNDAWRLSPDGVWRRVAPGGELPKLKRHVAATIGERMYLVGGFDWVSDTDGAQQIWNHDTFVYEPWATQGTPGQRVT